MKTTFIIVLNWNGKKDTIACLESLKKVKGDFETIVVDNGSTDHSPSAIRTLFPHITLIETGKNLGFAEGNNVGIRYAMERGAKTLFLLNNDTIVDPEILNAFHSTFQKYPEAGILGAKNYLFDSPNQFDHFGGMWNKKRANFDMVGHRIFDDGISWEEEKTLDYVCGCSFFVKREVIEKVGLLEAKFFLIWEESDFCFRAKKRGFLSMTCPKAKIWHKVSASFSGKPQSTYFWWRNRLLWIERNCSRAEKWTISFTILLPEILKILKLTFLKSLQNLFSPTPERQMRQLRYRAALSGVKDYLLRRFGNEN